MKKNLADVLRRLRHQTKSRILWTDAVCINQQDHHEKAHQVGFMFQIYSHANRVLVWLGDEAHGSDSLMEAISKIEPFNYLEEHLKFETSRTSKNHNMSWVNKDLKSPIEPDEQVTRALAKFWHRPWFRRVWVQQEVVAGSKISVLCGEKEVSCDQFLLWHGTSRGKAM